MSQVGAARGDNRAVPRPAPARPTKAELAAAAGRTVPDLVAPGLRVLFCGINPGLYSAAAGLHFARPGNRFWKALHGAGFTDRLLDPADQPELPASGLGITNLVDRATAAAAELGTAELRTAAAALERKLAILRPEWLAFVGMQAYRVAFRRPGATVGPQPGLVAGTRVWLLPNPSGLQARYQLPELIEAFAGLHRAAFGRA